MYQLPQFTYGPHEIVHLYYLGTGIQYFKNEALIVI